MDLLSHYHWVKYPNSEQEVQLKCNLLIDPCPFSEATPGELGSWLDERLGSWLGPQSELLNYFPDWLEEHRKPVKANAEIALGPDDPESAAIVDAVRKLTDEDGITKGVPFVRYNEFGDKTILGFAILEEKDGFISASFTIDAKSLLGLSPSKLFPRPSAAPPATKEEQDKWDDMGVNWDRLKVGELDNVCTDPACITTNTHKHGPTCTLSCPCTQYEDPES